MDRRILIGVGAAVALGAVGCGLFFGRQYLIQQSREAAVAAEAAGKPDEVKAEDLQNNVYYIKSGDTYYSSYVDDTTIDQKHAVSATADPKRLITYTSDVDKIPTLYSDDELIYFTSGEMPKFNWERFKDNGYSIGVYKLESNEAGKIQFVKGKADLNAKSDAYNGFASIQLPEGATGVVLETLNTKNLSSENLSEGGFISGLEKDDPITLEMYAGTQLFTVETKADTRYFSSFETFKSEEFELTHDGYAVIKIPEEFPSGYYLLNGSLFFRYVDGPKADGMPEGDLSGPYYYYDDKNVYTKEEWLEKNGDTSMREEAVASVSNTFTVPSNVVSMNVMFSYKNSNALKYPYGILTAPDGTETELELTDSGNLSTFKTSIDMPAPGVWTLSLYDIEGDHFAFTTTFEEGITSVSGSLQTEASEQPSNMTVTWTATEGTGPVTLTSPTGAVYSKDTTPESVISDEAGKTVFSLTSVEEGEWKASVKGDAGTVTVALEPVNAE